MTDDLRPGAPAATLVANVAEFTVSELSNAVKRTLEGAFDHVRVRGEVSRPNYHGSGHLYFTLKDENAVIDAVCWKGTVGRLGLRIEEGMEVVCTGRVSSYPRSSKYQLVIEAVELAGQGALLKLLEDRRKKLLAEGLFDPARKKPIPFLPTVIGVVTSPTGAVIRDILHRLKDRFPRRVLLWPVPVQGEGAAAKVAAAIAGFNRIAPGGPVPRPDVLIVARGGGSLEDLWAFNEEVVVRAAAASDIPLIAAIGHETDVTLIDFAADRRAPTPTAAAEMAVPVRADLIVEVMGCGQRLFAGVNRFLAEHRTRLDGLARGLPQPQRLFERADQDIDTLATRLSNATHNLLRRHAAVVEQLGHRLPRPREVIAGKEQSLKHLANLLDERAHRIVGDRSARFEGLHAAERLSGAAARLIAASAERLAACGQLLESLSYQGVLRRGFALVRRGDQPVTRAADTAPGMDVTIQFHDGERAAVIDGSAAAPAPRPPRRRDGGGSQGSLL
jgi:exodeoxyribonuclease VII large subunit